jgi:hypothetical protein
VVKLLPAATCAKRTLAGVIEAQSRNALSRRSDGRFGEPSQLAAVNGATMPHSLQLSANMPRKM